MVGLLIDWFGRHRLLPGTPGAAGGCGGVERHGLVAVVYVSTLVN